MDTGVCAPDVASYCADRLTDSEVAFAVMNSGCMGACCALSGIVVLSVVLWFWSLAGKAATPPKRPKRP